MLLRERLGESTFNRAWVEGQGLEFSAAIEYALSDRVTDIPNAETQAGISQSLVKRR